MTEPEAETIFQAAVDIIHRIEHEELGCTMTDESMKFILDRIRELVTELGTQRDGTG